MRNDQIFVLLLIVLLPMSGCFDGGGIGDADAQDSTNDDSTGGNGGDGSTSTPAQARTWYSSAGVYDLYWSDGQTSSQNENGSYVQITSNSERCLSWAPYYNSSTGEYEGERCSEFGLPQSENDWNLSDCTDNGGTVIWPYADYEYDYYAESPQYYRYAPDCRLSFTTINTTVGDALLIYEWSGFSVSSTCDGVNVYTNSGVLNGKEYVIAPGTALSCTHELYTTQDYSAWGEQLMTQNIWSIVYAIQDTTVV